MVILRGHYSRILYFLLLFLSLKFCSSLSSPSFSTNTSLQLCSYYDRLALIEFKNNFSQNSDASSECPTSYPKTKSWKEGGDCCSWDGVTCDTVTGRVIGLDLNCSWLQGSLYANNSLFRLSHLQKLNLAYNDFNNSEISPKFGQFKSLTDLDISNSMFFGEVPSEISHLSNLISLDISSNRLRFEDLPLQRLVQNCSLLKQLFLEVVDLSSIDTNSLMNLSSSLTDLRLNRCRLQGMFPSSILYLLHLRIVDLSDNEGLNIRLPDSNWSSPLEELHFDHVSFTGELPESIGDLISLKQLSLQSSNLTGSIPASIGNLLQLTHLQGDGNNFNGKIPSSLTNLSQLQVLSLENNKLVGPVPNFSNPSKLVHLDLQSNLLSGTIPSGLFNLPSLRSLDLSENQFTGPINEFQSQSLERLVLGGSNKLNGCVPSSIFNLVNLAVLDLSSNSFSGTLDVVMFSKLQHLHYLNLSDSSNLSFNNTVVHLDKKKKKNTVVHHIFPNLRRLYLASCNLTEFPYFIRDLKDLYHLDLSNNRLFGQIPEWMLEVGIDTLGFLNLGNNYLTGIKELPWKSLWFLDLHSNLLQGLLPIPVKVDIYLISNNNLTGEIPSLICNFTSLVDLDLSNNSFSGTIPTCFGSLSSLNVLNLQKNTFSGRIPEFFDEGSALVSLNLNDNQLEGPLPRSLANCKMLGLLDLGNNRINDTFPHWLKNLTQLQVLVLKSNHFHGSIQDCKDSHCFSKLQIFDISNNEFSGPLPAKYFENMQATMKTDGEVMRVIVYSFQDPIFVVMKRQKYQLPRIIVTFKFIDFSNNMFRGEIPDVIGKLTYLKGLNFSHNNIGGDIPSSLGNLRNLEWLDLSSNRLTGNIPRQLTSIAFLSLLNLSQNELVGPIPSGGQFNTFDNSSYEENLGLCGSPLSMACDNSGEIPQSPPSLQEEDDSGSWFDWKICIMMGYSSGLVMGLSVGYIVFSGTQQWLERMVERYGSRKVKRSTQRQRGGRN
ncbi:receptor-like protein 6 [Tripterygium wilfordii]|uniref:receptor-like protein 6 n=1 Tax=Tripterygium wilfordii TaxID=458696 RepID=UPI0018F8423C|nr:receptor-like protein 6 [Tripterygium wilfordii]